MDTKVNIGEARDTLSALVERAERGEAIVIARRGRPVVRLVPCEEAPRKPAFGWGRHLMTGVQRTALGRMTGDDWLTPDPSADTAMREKDTR